MKVILILLCSLSIIATSVGQTDPNHPNIILILADDLGVDVFNGYQDNNLKPVTPTLDSLRNAGVAFRNVWSTPQCATTRAAIMSGKYGIKTGVTRVPGNLDPIHTSIFEAVKAETNDLYADAVIGKWHISNPVDYTHPAQHGVDYYEGIFTAMVSNSYTDWEKVTGGIDSLQTVSNETEYVTSHLTNKASDWINAQSQPWLLWLAHAAPHAPFETPPNPASYSQSPTNSNRQKYIAIIEAMDYEINKLLLSIPTNVRDNTTIIFVGDNGTGGQVVQNFPSDRAKTTLYQGGVHVPLFVCGKNVSRQGEWDESLVHVTDIYATILEMVGADLPGGVNNSLSFNDLLNSSSSVTRPHNYVEISGNNSSAVGWAIRDSQYKLIQFDDGTQEFYDLLIDSLELSDLTGQLTSAQQTILTQLETEALVIRNGWSCQDYIQNGLESGIDCGTSSCGICVGSSAPNPCAYDSLIICNDIVVDSFAIAEDYILAAYTISSNNSLLQAEDCIELAAGFEFDGQEFLATIDDCILTGIDDTNCPNFNGLSYDDIGCGFAPTIASQYNESSAGDIRVITSNGLPNHNYDYNQNSPNGAPTPQNHNFNVDLTPTVAASPTSVLGNTNRPARYFGVAINGVIFAPAPAQPFIFENTSTGEFNYDWIFEPTNNIGTGMLWVGLDCASAHTGPQGYHYHGNMFEYAETMSPGLSTTIVAPPAPILIGWASDGFPILYRFGPDENNNLTLLQPSYSIKYGNRPGDGVSEPCGAYNGKYTRDYEYIDCSGDLDECNGVARTITLTTDLGTETYDYFYVITDAFPQVSRCMVGTPDPSFEN